MFETPKPPFRLGVMTLKGGLVGLSGLLLLACQTAPDDSTLTGRSQALAVHTSQSSPQSSIPLPPPTDPIIFSSAHPASVMFLLDTNESMQDFPQSLPEDFTPGYYPAPSTTAKGQRGYVGATEGDFINTGCSDPALVSAMSWFDKGSTDPNKNGSNVYDNDPDFGSTPFFQSGKFYQARGRRLAWQTKDYPFAVTSDFKNLYTSESSLAACYTVVNWNTDYFVSPELMNECQTCLDTQGWWRGPLITSTTGPGFSDSDYPPSRVTQRDGQAPPAPAAYRKWVVDGRVLNVRPPKFVVARKALKDTIATASNVRLGVASFGKDRGWFDPPWVLAGMSPSCDKSYPTFDDQALNRSQLKSAVNGVWFGHNERQIGESLFGLGGYFSSQVVDNQWATWFQQDINPGYFGWPGCCNGGTYDEPPGTPGHLGAGWGAASDEWLKAPITDPSTGQTLPGQPWEGTGNDKSVCFADQTTAIVVVTGGTPSYDNSVPITRMMEILKAHGARNPDGSLVQFDPSNPATNSNVGGINYCDQVVKNPATGEKYTKADCDYGTEAYNWPVGLGVGNKNFMDDVSFFLSHTDLRGDLPGDQTVRTYVIGFGDTSPMNQSIALAGQGQFYRTDSGAQVQQAVQQILLDLGNTPTP